MSEISIIVPAMNEERSIEECVRALVQAVPMAEILVVDGGSDRTGEIVRALGEELGKERVRWIANADDRGKGHAIRVGVEAARARVIVQFDADLQFSPEDVEAVAAPVIAERADLVLGSRFLPGAGGDLPGHATRSVGNRVTSAYASLLARQRLTDVLAGIKAWSREAWDVIALTSDGFSYEVELPMRALARGLRVVDVPVRYADRREGVSKVSVVRHGARILWDLTRFGLRDRRPPR